MVDWSYIRVFRGAYFRDANWVTYLGGVLIGFYGISKHHFLRGAVSLSSIIYVHCSTVDGGADQIWIAVVVRGGVVKIFDFAEVINE